MKKKLSVGLVLALVLALLVVGAIAATLLSSKEFVESVMAPKAAQDNSEVFEDEELKEILRIAEENGLMLSQDQLERLAYWGVEYKEELMRAIAKIDLGFYPSTWSLEDQLWYDQLLVDTGLSVEGKVGRFVPQEGELSQEEALQIVADVIHSQYDEAVDVTDETLYLRHMQYVLDEDGTTKIWMIEYDALTLEGDYYYVKLDEKGNVLEHRMHRGLRLEGDEPSTAGEVYDRYRTIYGDIYGSTRSWQPETWVAFHDALVQLKDNEYVERSEFLFYITQQTFGIPDESAMTRDEAYDLAANMLIEQGKATQDAVPRFNADGVYLMDGDVGVWKVFMPVSEGDIYLLEIDAHTGRIRSVRIRDYNTGWYMNYVLDSVAATEYPWIRVQPRAYTGDRVEVGELVPGSITSYMDALVNVQKQETPVRWHSTVAPDYFWEAMDAMGFNKDTAQGLVDEWIGQYSPDMQYWPLDKQAIIYLWVEPQDSLNDPFMNGLPGEGDILQEQAEAIAWEAYTACYQESYEGEVPQEYILVVGFAYNVREMGDHVWTFNVTDPTRSTGGNMGYIQVDAKTGEVLYVNANIYSNG